MKKFVAIILSCSLLVTSGCAIQPDGFKFQKTDTKIEKRSEKEKIVPISKTDSPEVKEIYNSSQPFSQAAQMADLLDTKENIVISPLSINMALAMIYNGAKNNTEAELNRYLGYTSSEMNEIYKAFIESLKTEDLDKIYTANSLWYNRNNEVSVIDGFEKNLKDFYNADVFPVDFSNKTTVSQINNWVSKNTEENIKEIINELDPQTVSVLINTLFFKGTWKEPYDKDFGIKAESFTNMDNSISEVDMMGSTEKEYIENDKATGFIKPYKDYRYAFVGILPKETNNFNISDLNLQTLLDSSTKEYKVETSMPKFEVEYSNSLVETLEKMEIKDIFTPKSSDLTGAFNSNTNVYINEVIHKAKISVDENGTVASAATIMSMTYGSMMINPPEVKIVELNRPFVFMIIDRENNIPLFIGRINQM